MDIIFFLLLSVCFAMRLPNVSANIDVPLCSIFYIIVTHSTPPNLIQSSSQKTANVQEGTNIYKHKLKPDFLFMYLSFAPILQ
ncbi:hypothetical protein M413DRAFT_404329 [Hebeloma cylindrosporum]|uniref:Secreted protein n=1 Tax=Hebeloma cylindrosporum TaxID=76867 RepID=A0A0C2X9S0_HEBCY|nr:hypothetical protein M413DRAFT_404329 [Hebeloma cylindrosporum h7]